MPRSSSSLPRPLARRRLLVAAVAALPLAGVALAGTAFPGAGVAHAAGSVSVLAGNTPATTPFPSDAFTVADARQLTGRRVNLPTPGCPDPARSLCDDLRLLNQLDGFDLQPRVTIPFSGPVDLLSVNDATVFVANPGGLRMGLRQLVVDPVTGTVSGTTDGLLAPSTTYSLVVTAGLRALDGSPVAVCPTVAACPGGSSERRTTFTTTSATSVLDGAEKSLDDGSAYTAAGITDAQRGVDFHARVGSTDSSIFPAAAVGPDGITRNDQKSADPAAPLVSTSVLNTAAGYATYGFGSIRSPQLADGNGVIANVPTSQRAPVGGMAEIGVTMVAPPTSASGCITPVIFGPGFTRSRYDLFLAADAFGASNIAVFATDPLGHAFGPRSTTTVTTGPTATTTLKGFGRGKDLDGDGMISESEGVGPSYSVTVNADGTTTPRDPSPDALVGLRDGLIQTVVDDMALVRALERGADVTGDGVVDTCLPTPANPNPVRYYGQSFGGIYGTMLLGTDPHVQVGVPNVPGGPIVDIARESGFRNSIARQMQANRPNLLNGGPGLNGFTESIPLRLDPRVTRPVGGAIAVQEYFARGNWLERAGSPETYAARLGARALFGGKKIIFQTAHTDGTVPNPTAGVLYRAGDLYDKVWVYRNDRTATVNSDPHGFLLDPRLAGRNMGQQQIVTFLSSAGMTVNDPDGTGPIWENNPALYRVQLDCLHYPDPQTGTMQARTTNSPDCTDRSGTLAQPQLNSPVIIVDPGGGGGGVATGPATLTLRASRTFAPLGRRVTFSGRLTRAGAPVAAERMLLSVRYVDGQVKPLGGAATGTDGSYTLTVKPLYNGTVIATAAGATAAVPSRVIVTYRSVRASASGRTVTVLVQTRPGFATRAGRAERAQLLLVDARGHTLRVLASTKAGSRHGAPGEAQGVNDIRFRVTLPTGSARLVVKVLGTPVNTGASSRAVTVRVS